MAGRRGQHCRCHFPSNCDGAKGQTPERKAAPYAGGMYYSDPAPGCTGAAVAAALGWAWRVGVAGAWPGVPQAGGGASTRDTRAMCDNKTLIVRNKVRLTAVCAYRRPWALE